MKTRNSVFRLSPAEASLIYLVLLLFILIVAYPLFWTLYTSLKPQLAIFENPFALPDRLFLDNYARAFKTANFGRYLANSLIVVIPSLFGIIFLSTTSGYAFARFRFRGSTFLFLFFLVGIMVPTQAIIVFVYKIVSSLKLLNSYFSLIFTFFSWISVGVFIMRSFFRSLPDDILESARIEGCSEFRIYLQIASPLSVPSIATIGIFYFVWVWNNFLYPLLFLQNVKLSTIPMGIMLFKAKYTVDWGLQCAALTIATMPALLLYFIFQKRFVKGLTAGAIKG
jgi:ABC-type glycerol-3-phosphate transport system permease component